MAWRRHTRREVTVWWQAEPSKERKDNRWDQNSVVQRWQRIPQWPRQKEAQFLWFMGNCHSIGSSLPKRGKMSVPQSLKGNCWQWNWEKKKKTTTTIKNKSPSLAGPRGHRAAFTLQTLRRESLDGWMYFILVGNSYHDSHSAKTSMQNPCTLASPWHPLSVF